MTTTYDIRRHTADGPNSMTRTPHRTSWKYTA